MKKYTAPLSALLITAFTVPAALAIPITVTSNNIFSYAYDDATTNNQQNYTDTTVPATQTLTASSGNSSSTTNINYSGNANSAIFAVDMLHSIDNSAGITSGLCCDIAQTTNSSLFFTANSNASYSISGFYESVSSAGTRIFLDVYLQDLTTGTMLFRDLSMSENIINESFVLDGLAEGNIMSSALGSLTGNLTTGNNYRFFFNSITQAFSAGKTTAIASANGYVSLSIGTPAAVSEPSILMLMVIGILAMSMLQKYISANRLVITK